MILVVSQDPLNDPLDVHVRMGFIGMIMRNDYAYDQLQLTSVKITRRILFTRSTCQHVVELRVVMLVFTCTLQASLEYMYRGSSTKKFQDSCGPASSFNSGTKPQPRHLTEALDEIYPFYLSLLTGKILSYKKQNFSILRFTIAFLSFCQIHIFFISFLQSDIKFMEQKFSILINEIWTNFPPNANNYLLLKQEYSSLRKI